MKKIWGLLFTCIACSGNTAAPAQSSEPDSSNGGQAGEPSTVIVAGAHVVQSGGSSAMAGAPSSGADDGGAVSEPSAGQPAVIVAGSGGGGAAGTGAGGTSQSAGEGGAAGEPEQPITGIPTGALDCRGRVDGQCSWCKEELAGSPSDHSYVYDKSLPCTQVCSTFGTKGPAKRFALGPTQCARVTTGDTGHVRLTDADCQAQSSCFIATDTFYVAVNGADWTRVETGTLNALDQCSLKCQ